MEKHILLDKAKTYKMSEEISTPKDCSYDRICGFWRNNISGEVMMVGDHSERLQTKKCDVETGEDQKGE